MNAEIFPIGIRGIAKWFRVRLILAAIWILVVSLTPGCNKKSQPAPEVRLTIIDESWVDKPCAP